MYRLIRALDCGEDAVLCNKPWAPTRVQLERLMTFVNGEKPSEDELDEQCERFVVFMVPS